MLKKLLYVLFSTRFMAIVLAVFSLAMAVATFIENDYGPTTSKALIYHTKWFELLMVLLVVNFIGNVFRYKLYRRQKRAVLLMHVAFIITLIGGGVTRYFGFEGIVPIREGQQTSTIYSDKTYINARVDDDKFMKHYEREVLFAQAGNNNYSFGDVFSYDENNRIPFSITMDHFIARAKETFTADEKGINMLHLVKPGEKGRKNIYLAEGATKTVDHVTFSFNHYVEGGINFFQDQQGLTLQAPTNGTYMQMGTGSVTPVVKDSITLLHLRHLYSFGNLKFVAVQVDKGKVIRKTAPKQEQDLYPYDMLTLTIQSGGKSKTIDIQGRKGIIMPPSELSLNGLNFAINYGSKLIQMPFSLTLRDFQMERYPGTNSASSYASELTVIDSDTTFDYRIFMNHVLDYKGYRFFQASYDKDELGTVLSVNHDYWGTWVTYLGYILMAIGMFFTLFWKGSHFKALSQQLKIKKKSGGVFMVLLLCFLVVSTAKSQTQPTDEKQQYVVSKAHADAFGRLLIQDLQGRIKPVNTYALEALRKVFKQDSYQGLSAEQVLLSAQLNPTHWSKQRIIAAKPKILGEKITEDLHIKTDLAVLTDCFSEGKYYFTEKVNRALAKEKTARTAVEQEIIDFNERINVWWGMLYGRFMRIYPKKDDSNNTWYTGIDKNAFARQDTMILHMHQLYMVSLQEAVRTGNYSESDEYLSLIVQYQQKLANDIIPSPRKVALEIKYNKWSIFKNMLLYYMIVGVVLLALTFADLFSCRFKKTIDVGLRVMTLLTVLGMLIHALGLGMRWYISGHAPWSNGYEAVVFVSFVTVLAGLIFSYKRSPFTLTSATLFASFLLGIAQGSMMNPQITTLVPVLKSYWLMIHVAVITASYGFLGVGALLGFVVLLLYIIRTPDRKDKLNSTIKELTYINESTLTVGLFTLSIGTFLGGVWANESWGRYWGWDPKEVWALISMMVYIFILHMRLVPGLRGQFAFNLASLFSISTLIMTFFGVNYYLSGMHSYAGGDPVPVPSWIYVAIISFALFATIAYFKHQQFKKKV